MYVSNVARAELFIHCFLSISVSLGAVSLFSLLLTGMVGALSLFIRGH